MSDEAVKTETKPDAAPEEAGSYLCAFCEAYGRQVRATTVIGGKPACGPCFLRECAC